MMGRDTRQDVERVTAFMQALAATPLDAPPPPDPSLIWWKAQMLRRWDAEQEAAAPIDVGERVQLGIGFAGVVALLAWLWRSAPAAFGTTALMLIGVTILAVAAAAALTAWSVGVRD
jgi:hypothetical protein